MTERPLPPQVLALALQSAESEIEQMRTKMREQAEILVRRDAEIKKLRAGLALSLSTISALERSAIGR